MDITLHGEPCWRLKHGPVELHVTRTGGQMAPVTFDLGEGRVAHPYSLAPWCNPAKLEKGRGGK
jgi:hypothetical protein